jgi:hypothetical protein
MNRIKCIALAAVLWLAGMFAAGAQTAPPAPQRIGMSEKICQLTGDTDWETNKPSLDRTRTNFGLEAVDLGYPVEHGDKLILLFGDTRPATHGGGPAGEIPPDDSVGFTTRHVPPGSAGKCLDLKLNDQPGNPGAPKKLAPPTIVGPVKVKQGWFNVPSGGVSVGCGLFVFFWTDHCTGPAHLEPSPNAPLAYPPPSQICSENDDRNSIGRPVLARSSDDGRTFSGVVAMPTGFVYATALDAMQQADLPRESAGGRFHFRGPALSGKRAVSRAGAARELRRPVDLALLRGARRQRAQMGHAGRLDGGRDQKCAGERVAAARRRRHHQSGERR